MDNKDVAQELRSKGAALAKAKTEGYRGMYFGMYYIGNAIAL